MAYRQVIHDERCATADRLHQGYSYRQIGYILGRSPSTICRERQRNAITRDGHYRAEKAQQYAAVRRKLTRKKSQFSELEWAAVEKQLLNK